MAGIPLDEDMDSAAMAEAMGFSGFGMQPGAKKRKMNPNADASVSGLPKKPSAAAGRNTTGANSSPLGQRHLSTPSASLPSRPPVAAAVAASARNAEEIDLGDDENGEDAVNRRVSVAGALEEADSDSRYLDTSRPSRGYLPEELADMEAQARPGQQVGSPSNVAGPFGRHQTSKYAQDQHQSGRRTRGAGQNADGQPWWEGYYDAKMNENPWGRLEKQRGLEPRGTWLSRHFAASAGPPETETVHGPETVQEGGQEIPGVEAGDEP